MRAPTDPAERLPQWRAARAKLTPGEAVNAAEFAKLAGMTWRYLKLLIDKEPEFPVLERGAEGKAWSFDAAEALDYLIARAERLVADKTARDQRIQRMTGLAESGPGAAAVGSEQPGSIAASARDMKALGEAQMIAHKLKVSQKEYVLKAPTVALLNDLMITMQAETLAVAARVDPAGRLDPATRALLDEELRNVLTTVQGKLAAWLDTHATEPD